MTLVVDASVAIKWLIEEDGTDAAEALRGRRLAAPQLIRVEVANVLRTIAARGLTPPASAAELLALFQGAPVDIVDVDDALERRALDLAMALAHHSFPALFCAGRGHFAFHIFSLFRRRQDGRHPQRFDPKLARPSHRMIKMLVLLFFHLFEGPLERLRLLAFHVFADFADQFPV